MSLDYKQKYLELRAKMLENMDISFRMGYEQGFAEGQKQAQQEAQAMQQQMMQQQAMAGQPPMEEGGQPMSPEEQAMMEQEGAAPPEMAGQGEEIPPEEQEAMAPQESSNLDAHINELESLVAKGEKPSILSMRTAVNKLSDLRKNQKEKFKRNQTQVISAQKKLVDNILIKWEKEAEKEREESELGKIFKDSDLNLED